MVSGWTPASCRICLWSTLLSTHRRTATAGENITTFAFYSLEEIDRRTSGQRHPEDGEVRRLTVDQIDELVPRNGDERLATNEEDGRVDLCCLGDRASARAEGESDDAARAIGLGADRDQRPPAPPDPLEMSERDRSWSANLCRGPRSQVCSRHTVTIGHIHNAFVASDGKTGRLDEVNLHEAFDGRTLGTQNQQLRAGRVESDDNPGRSNSQIHRSDCVRIGSNRK